MINYGGLKPANPKAVVSGNNYRITILTSQLLRLEYHPDGKFEDRATRTVINRDFPVPEFRVVEKGSKLEILTEHLHLSYDRMPFSPHSLKIHVLGNLTVYHSTWFYGGSFKNLKGTARTLDGADGAIELEDGLLSSNGFSVVDDSKSLLINDDGWFAPRTDGGIDLYFFGYGHDYKGCLKDFFKLSGQTPLLPRYALGNWWSRYHQYTEETYRELIETFAEDNIPFSVAVIDMDWHLVDVDPKYGSGWTGYTWNRELFPDPKSFMDFLHQKGMRVTLNVHPAEGVRAFEDAYPEMAAALGVDAEAGDKIHFDAADRKFMEAYFKYLHHPHEENGVDFWWLDWQQDGGTSIPGLDPLWILNHCHYLDSSRSGKRPLTFSRYAGIGSHRYPVGFSGDTHVTWASLEFQPYFTATASNAGYGWWSHDIGGHMHGVKDDEMAVRWLQFGVFSPITRLHSTKNPFNSKHPRDFNPIAEAVMQKFLRLRHKLVPYLYSMNYVCHNEGEPLVQPMYYGTPEAQEAYQVPNQYRFGSQLMVCPITKPADKSLALASTDAWLPEGTYIDIFNGMIYHGNRKITFFRDISTLPVLAKAGAILPFAGDDSVSNEVSNPQSLDITVFAGDNGSFELYEDDNTECVAVTKLEFNWDKRAKFVMSGVNADFLPEKRSITLKFAGFDSGAEFYIDGSMQHADYDTTTHTFTLAAFYMQTAKDVTVELRNAAIAENDINARCYALLALMQIEYNLKSKVFDVISRDDDMRRALGELIAMRLPEGMLSALAEIITA